MQTPINPFYAARRQVRRLRASTDANASHKVLDLFSGIGGFSLGLQWAGMHTVAFCEIDSYCRRVLSKHWPKTPIYHDIRELTARRLQNDGITSIDLICGGYPCQPFSIAGKQLGEADPRYLWPEMYRLIREVRPRWVIAENVAGHIERGLDTVLSHMDAAGYTAWTFVIPACAVGAPHRRDRVWIIAHATGVGSNHLQRPKVGPSAAQLPPASVWRDLPSPFTCRSDDGIPSRVERARALGNAVVPQIPEIIGRAIIAYEQANTSRAN